MGNLRQCARAWVLVCLPVTLSIAWVESRSQAQSPQSDATDREVAALAERIDRHLAARWAANGVKPTRPADDAEFLRRVSLDLMGRIPRLNRDLHDYLADKSPGKRQRVVQRMLDGGRYAEHFTNVWRQMLIPPGNNLEAQALARNFDPWLQEQFRKNVPYDAMVRELLTTPLAANTQPAPQTGAQPGPPAPPTPVAFYQVNESKPENLAASASRLFLGVKLECAQCHNHPFAAWTREQFWELAAFFSGVAPQQPNAAGMPPAMEDPMKRTIKFGSGDKEKEVEARFLDGKEPKWQSDVPTRQTLADWMTAADNPYFARNAVNRLWANFFGIGLIEPIDDLGPDNPPSHPELLNELTRAFIEHKFDVQFMFRAITSTKAYQLSSALTDPSQKDPRLFARMTVKGMSGEQLYDSLVEAIGFAEQPISNRQPGFPGTGARAEFLAKFDASNTKRTEYQTSILQALSLMNGTVMADATTLNKGRLGAVIDLPIWNTRERIDELYLSAVARKPRPEERERLAKYVDKGGKSGDSKKALADVFWALLNSSEFIFNH